MNELNVLISNIRKLYNFKTSFDDSKDFEIPSNCNILAEIIELINLLKDSGVNFN